jgi:hypothetical protein
MEISEEELEKLVEKKVEERLEKKLEQVESKTEEKEKIDRRQFLKIAGLGAGALGLSSATSAWSILQPSSQGMSNINAESLQGNTSNDFLSSPLSGNIDMNGYSLKDSTGSISVDDRIRVGYESTTEGANSTDFYSGGVSQVRDNPDDITNLQLVQGNNSNVDGNGGSTRAKILYENSYFDSFIKIRAYTEWQMQDTFTAGPDWIRTDQKEVQYGSSGARIYVDSNGEIVAENESGSTTQLT